MFGKNKSKNKDKNKKSKSKELSKSIKEFRKKNPGKIKISDYEY